MLIFGLFFLCVYCDFFPCAYAHAFGGCWMHMCMGWATHIHECTGPRGGHQMSWFIPFHFILCRVFGELGGTQVSGSSRTPLSLLCTVLGLQIYLSPRLAFYVCPDNMNLRCSCLYSNLWDDLSCLPAHTCTLYYNQLNKSISCMKWNFIVQKKMWPLDVLSLPHHI